MNIIFDQASTLINALLPISLIGLGVSFSFWLAGYYIVTTIRRMFDEPAPFSSHRMIARPISEMPEEELAMVHYTINAKAPPPEIEKEKERCTYCGGKTRPNWVKCQNCGAPL
jgi:hypothetical protein